jgi:hypothetical protein
MKGKLLYVILAFVVYLFFHFFNANLILHYTLEESRLEKSFHAECNIKNELKVERGELLTGKNEDSLVPIEMAKYLSQEKAENVIYIQETEETKTPAAYCIIDLLTPKAEAVTAVQPD